MNAWISVKDSLPQDGESVLLYARIGDKRTYPDLFTGYLVRRKWEVNCVCDYSYDQEPFEVTHWMLLPEHPKESS